MLRARLTIRASIIQSGIGLLATFHMQAAGPEVRLLSQPLELLGHRRISLPVSLAPHAHLATCKMFVLATTCPLGKHLHWLTNA